jgi:hypothetical protein
MSKFELVQISLKLNDSFYRAETSLNLLSSPFSKPDLICLAQCFNDLAGKKRSATSLNQIFCSLKKLDKSVLNQFG